MQRIKYAVWLSIFLSLGWLTFPSRGESVIKTMGRASQSQEVQLPPALETNSNLLSKRIQEEDDAEAVRRWQAVVHWNSVVEWNRVVEENNRKAQLERERLARIEAAKNAAASRTKVVLSGDVWERLGACESGNNPRAVSRNGLYFGAFQFSLATWRSVGESGNPTEHSYATQLEAAKRLQARSGWGQWPRCSKRLGLR